MAVSKRLRFEILRRDNHACRYCGATAPDVKLVVDHVIPETLGGKTEPENLVTACEPCNSGKTSIAPSQDLVGDVRQDALRWARAMDVATRNHKASRRERDGYRDAFRGAWEEWTHESGDSPTPVELPVEWPVTIDAMQRSGLDEEDLEDAVDTAMRTGRVKDRFRYFCGVAWNMVRTRQESAAKLVAGDTATDNTQVVHAPDDGGATEALEAELWDANETDLLRWTAQACSAAKDRDEDYGSEPPVAAVAAAAIAHLREVEWRYDNAVHRLLARFPQGLVAAAREQAVVDYERFMPGDYDERDVQIQAAYYAGEALEREVTA